MFAGIDPPCDTEFRRTERRSERALSQERKRLENEQREFDVVSACETAQYRAFVSADSARILRDDARIDGKS